jgi:predicted metal-binding membrane protein
MGGMLQEQDGMVPMPMVRDVWTFSYLTSALTMWALMMVAMMLPSAMPMILLYSRFSVRSGGNATSTIFFAFTYLLIWLLFSGLATVAQAALVATALASHTDIILADNRLSGALLVAAGVYQLSPLKSACLKQCQSPLSFVMRFWRPGWKGGLRLGLLHGLFCLGCCWVLMLLLFVGGVMNLAWIAALTLVVLVEKLAPQSLPVRKIVAVLLILGGFSLGIGVQI